MIFLTDEPVVLTSAEIDRAVASAGAPAEAAVTGHHAESTHQPAEGLRLASDVLARLAAGHIVTLIPERALLTVYQAADLLAVTPAVVKDLIDRGKLAARAVESARAIRYSDLVAYQRRETAEREKALVELTQLSQELGLY